MLVTRRPLLGAALLATLLLTACGKPRPNVLLVTLDTTRADFIGCYGKEEARTENLDRLAAEGVLFERAMVSNPVTQPSHSTILTGTYPMLHGVRDNMLFQLPEQRQTLAEILAGHGYRTGAAIGGFPLVRSFGLDQGFEFYDDDLKAGRRDHRGQPIQRNRATWYDERPAGHVNDAILPWLRDIQNDPFFVWLHYWDPHEPHIAPAPWSEIFAHDPYQGEIAYADQSLGVILGELEKQGQLDNTVVVITSDHGESRMEHGEMTHAFLAYNSALHVPLILKAPNLETPGEAAGYRVPETVGTVDIVPTILDLLDLPIPEEIQGRSLVPLMRGESTRERRPYYSESLSPRLSHGFGELRVLHAESMKYIHGPRSELFNIDEDPHERRDLIDGQEQEAKRLEAALADFIVDHASADAADATHDVDDETRRRLEALGYISTSDESLEGGLTVQETLSTEGGVPQDHVGQLNLVLRLRRFLDAGDFAAARDTALKLLAADPDHRFFRAKLAAAYLGLEETEQAAEIVDQASEISAANLNEFLNVAEALFNAGQEERGYRMAQRLAGTEAGRDSSASHWTLAGMARRLDSADDFLQAIERTLAIDPDHGPARRDLAEHYLKTGRLEQAENELRLLLSTYPTHREGSLSLARLLVQQGDPDGALGRLGRTLRLHPGFCDAHVERIRILVGLGRNAQQAFQEMQPQCRGGDSVQEAAELLKEL